MAKIVKLENYQGLSVKLTGGEKEEACSVRFNQTTTQFSVEPSAALRYTVLMTLAMYPAELLGIYSVRIEHVMAASKKATPFYNVSVKRADGEWASVGNLPVLTAVK